MKDQDLENTETEPEMKEIWQKMKEKEPEMKEKEPEMKKTGQLIKDQARKREKIRLKPRRSKEIDTSA